MSETTSISAHIPKELGKMLEQVARTEERSKSYYIKKGLEQFLKSRLEDMADFEEAKQAYQEYKAAGEKPVPVETVFKNVK